MDSDLELLHLWRNAAFGATPEDFDRSRRQGYAATVDEMVDYDAIPESLPEPPATTIIPPGVTMTLVQAVHLIQWWINVMIDTRRPLQERLVLFWHGHFTTSLDPVFSAALLLRQNQTIRRLAAGRFEDLLLAMSQDPAMLVYLDGHQNRKSHPNENYARELLELFTLGIGHYTERDVREAARAFTGWGIRWPQATFRFDSGEHDDGPKRFLGRTGDLDGQDVVRILAEHPQAARHVVSRLYRFLAGADADGAEVERLAGIFLQHHGTIRVVVKAILMGTAFRELARTRPGYKSPVEFVASAARALRGHFDRWELVDPLRLMGQLPFLPPSVKGWDDGAAWINTESLLDRINMAHLLVEDASRSPGFAAGMAALTQHPAGDAVARRTLFALGLPDASPETHRFLAQAWDGGDARRLLELALASPDFQRR